MAEAHTLPNLDRVVEVLVPPAAGVAEWGFGSGYEVADGVVLTAHHVLGDAREVRVRFHGGRAEELELDGRLAWAGHDIALIKLRKAAASPPIEVPILGDPERVAGEIPFRAVGFPGFKRVARDRAPPLRDSHQIDGTIPLAANLKSARLVLQTRAHPPRAQEPTAAGSRSPWEGMSGAAVFSGDCLVGVITVHRTPEGDATLTAARIAVVENEERVGSDDRARFWALLGVAPGAAEIRPLEPRPDSTAAATPPFQAPTPAAGFVARPDVAAAAKARLLADDAGTLTVMALHGMAGSGKSVMAAAVAGHPETRRRFPDGVVWATLGTESNTTAILAGWIRALSEPSSAFGFQPTTQDLDALTRDKAVLLVIDDVWQPEHALPLVAGGPRCAVLLTTREGRVARACGVRAEDVVEVGPMTGAQALALLAGGEGRTMPESVREQALAVAEAVGFLPLALRLAAAQSADGIPWQELHDDLTAEIARLESLDDPELAELEASLVTKELSLIGSLNLSVSRLPAERGAQFAWLGVLRDDAAITASIASTLWDTDERSAREALRYFRSKALLMAEPVGDGAPTYSIHDTLHALARRLLTRPAQALDRDAPAGLGLELQEAQRRLLDRYRRQRTDETWHTVPDDGYIHDHLIWHLERAGGVGEVHALLREETPAGRNAWFSVRQFHGYAADLRRALELAQGDVALEVRYLLMLASLSSLASHVPPALAATALATGVWSLTQALGYVEQMPDPAQRARSLAAMARCLAAPDRNVLLVRAFELARTLEHADEAIAQLVPCLAAEGFTAEALELARQASWGDPRASMLAAVASHMEAADRQNVVGEALEVVRGTSEVYRSAALEPLLPFLSEDSLRRLLDESRGMENPVGRSWVISSLAQRLADCGELDEALDAADGIDDVVERALALARLASSLDEPRRSETVRQVLAFARGIDVSAWRKWQDAAFEPHGPLLAGAVALAIMGQYADWRADLLRALPGDLAPTARQEALALADDWGVGRILAAGDSPQGPEQGRAELESIRSAGTESWRADALARIVEQLDDAGLAEALEIAAEMQEPESRARALEALAPDLPRSLLVRGLELVPIADGEALLLAGCALAPGLKEPQLAELLERAEAHAGEYVRARALALLAPYLPGRLLEPAARLARALSGGTAKAEVALPALAKRCPDPAKTALLRDAINTAAALDDGERIAWALDAFADQLPPPLLDEAVTKLTAAASRIAPEFRDLGLAKILAVAAPHLQHDRKTDVVAQALTHVGRIEQRKWQAEVLTELGPALSEQQFEQALALMEAMPDPFERARAYAWIAASAPARRRKDIVERAHAELPHFTGDDFLTADEQAQIVAISTFPHTMSTAARMAAGAEALSGAARSQATSLADALAAKMLDTIETFDDEGWRSRALAGVSKTLPPGLSERAVGIAQTISDGDHRALALVALARARTAERAPLIEAALHAALAVETSLLHDAVLSRVTQAALDLPADEARRLWARALPALATVPRPDLLAKLHSLGPFVCALDEGILPRTHRALTDVARWWP